VSEPSERTIPQSSAEVPAHTGSRATRVLGATTLAGFAALLLYGLVLSPPDQDQGESVRLMYVHVPVATIMFLSFGITTLGSAMYLWKRSRWWDTLAAAAAEVGVVFTGLCLLTGMLWGRPTWGVYWTWDARLTSTALLFLLYIGYLAVRRLPADVDVRNRRSAYVALLAFVDVPIVHFSVSWWRSLHQGPTITKLDPTISGLMLFSLMVGFAVFSLLYAWLLIHRFRLAWLEDELEERGLETAIEARRAEAVLSGGAGT
jgi:heme exporter protein C